MQNLQAPASARKNPAGHRGVAWWRVGREWECGFPAEAEGPTPSLGMGGDGQASAGSPPRRRGRLGLAGRRWRRLRRWEGSWVIFRRGRVGSLLMLLLVRPLALATRHTRRGTGSYKGRRGRRSGRSHNTIARAGNSRALFESVASRLSTGCCSARGLDSGLVGDCSWPRRRSSRVWLQGRAEGSLDKGRWSGSGLGQRARHSR